MENEQKSLTAQETGIIGPLADNFINGFIEEMKKKKYKDQIMKNVIEPILDDINNRYYPHMLTLTVLLALIIILLIMLLLANTNNKTKH